MHIFRDGLAHKMEAIFPVIVIIVIVILLFILFGAPKKQK